MGLVHQVQHVQRTLRRDKGICHESGLSTQKTLWAFCIGLLFTSMPFYSAHQHRSVLVFHVKI